MTLEEIIAAIGRHMFSRTQLNREVSARVHLHNDVLIGSLYRDVLTDEITLLVQLGQAWCYGWQPEEARATYYLSRFTRSLRP
jgi:hypothetical protein